MIFANATYLWGLLGLLLPIAIHLWSRKKVKTIKIGSTKLLQASEPKQTSSLKLSELWLLFLRLLIILLLVFILAEPVIPSNQKNSSISYIIEPELISDERFNSIVDTIPKESVRILKNGFPYLEDYDFDASEKSSSYWQLAQQMRSIPSDSIIVFSRGYLKGIKGARPTIYENTKWIVLEPNERIDKVISITEKESFVSMISMGSDSNILTFKKDTISLDSDLLEINTEGDSVRLSVANSKDWLTLKKGKQLRIGIVNNDTLKDQINYFKAAYRGISKFLNRPIEIEILERLDDVIDKDFDTLILFENKLPVNHKATLLICQNDSFASEIIVEGPSKHIFYLTKLLDSENIVAEDLPEKLIALLDLDADLYDSIISNDSRVLAESELQPIKKETKSMKNTAGFFEVTPWLWLIFILIVVAERILSKLRKQ